MVAPLLLAALSPLVKGLFENGLHMLGNAVLAKGKAAVEEKLGVKLPDEQQAPTPDQLLQMRQLQFEHEEALLAFGVEKEKISLELEKSATEAITKRWEADMLSDSWLSKNIRPLALLHTLAVMDILLACAVGGLEVPDNYLALVGQLLMLMAGAYFVGRTVEKGVDLYQGWKQTKGE